MKTLTKFETAVRVNAVITRKIALLAYLEYHYENPSLHPDDIFSAGSGYSDLGGVIVCQANMQKMPAYVEYPSSILKIGHFIFNLHNLTEIEEQHVEVIEDFLDTFDEAMLDDVIYSMDQLKKFDEDNTVEEIIEILNYVKGAN